MHISSSRSYPPVVSTAIPECAMSFTSAPRGACLAGLLLAQCLDSWGHPYDSDVTETLTLISTELCAYAGAP
ncbi:hypothetical protein [Streptomyces sp. NPDC000229]|uniref:hypothetical protein n=1 Tax=Streptomyces sp. NPDC000229 TaxID=3154247 RepID=UPI00332C190E